MGRVLLAFLATLALVVAGEAESYRPLLLLRFGGQSVG
jgi:hypothetical protein